MSRTRRRRARLVRAVRWLSRDGWQIEIELLRDRRHPWVGPAAPEWIARLDQVRPRPLPGMVRGKFVRRSNKSRRPA